jgi:hypothetical protein
MPTNNQRTALAFAAVIALAPVTAHATIARAIKFDDKVEHAAAIVVGRCVAQKSEWDSSRQRILTWSTFKVEKTLKGAPAQEITLVTPGGTVGDIAQDFVGVPRFDEGDDSVVFVRNTKAGPTVLYLEQGAYGVETDARGQRMVRPMVSNAVLVDPVSSAAVAPEGPQTLAAFEDSVRETVKRREAFRMEMIAKQKRDQASLWSTVQRNRGLVIIALLGAVLATWQLVKRT